jgi:hypothetical protein
MFIIYLHMYLTLIPYRGSFCKLCPSNYPINKSWYIWGTMTCYCVVKHASQSWENCLHCCQLLNLAEIMCMIVPFVRAAHRICQYSSYIPTKLFLNAIVICLAFIVHHMPTFKSQRGTSWIKRVLAELQYQLFWEETGVYDFWDVPWLQDFVHLWVHSDPLWWSSRINVRPVLY